MPRPYLHEHTDGISGPVRFTIWRRGLFRERAPGCSIADFHVINRDIIVIGASAGGLETLRTLAARLPQSFPAAVFVVIHLPSTSRSFLPDVLSRAGSLPAAEPMDGDPIQRGRIYVAPPDYHLLVSNGHIHLTRSPKEGHQRPAINVTFRSAATSYGSRVIGVVLTGMLDDGSAGLWEIKNRGGVAVVQDPDDALFPSMPRNAIQQVPVDYRSSIDEMPLLLVRLCEGEDMKDRLPRKRVEEKMEVPNYLGFTCPECQGPLVETGAEPTEFRCRVGHAFSTRMPINGQAATRERKLYEAMVALEESVDIVEFAASRAIESKRGELVQQAADLRRHAESVKSILDEIKL